MRDASIHIRESVLIRLIEEDLNEHGTPFGKNAPTELAKRILEKAKGHSCSNRGVYVTNKKLEEKVTKLKLSNRSDAGIFSQLLLICRRQLKHRGLQLIQPGDPEWFSLKEVTKYATDFCNEFQVDVKKGYKEYILIALPMMKNFSLGKFKSMHSSICNIYEAKQEIDQDKEPDLTRATHDYYLALVAEKTGITQGYEEQPDKYKYFLQAKNEAKKFGISYKQYLQAQFQGFDWRSGIPDPTQLVGIKAIQRLQTWAYEKNFKLGDKKRKVDFKKLKG